MKKKLDIRYWDACVFISLFNKEMKNADDLAAEIERRGNEGILQIVASSISLVEVIKTKNRINFAAKDQAMIKAYFQHDYIKKRNVDVAVAEKARELIWKHKHLKAYDAVHIATAILSKVPILESTDHDLLKLHDKIPEYDGEIRLLKIGEIQAQMCFNKTSNT